MCVITVQLLRINRTYITVRPNNSRLICFFNGLVRSSHCWRGGKGQVDNKNMLLTKVTQITWCLEDLLLVEK